MRAMAPSCLLPQPIGCPQAAPLCNELGSVGTWGCRRLATPASGSRTRRRATAGCRAAVAAAAGGSHAAAGRPEAPPRRAATACCAATKAVTVGPTASVEGIIEGCDVDTSCYGVGSVILGIDIGGTTIKAAPVDTKTGRLAQPKHVIGTPQPATPEACAGVIGQMIEHFEWDGAVGIGLPAVVRQGIVLTAANIDKGWIGTDAAKLFGAVSPGGVVVVNDADAAGYCEMGFGAGAEGDHQKGVVCMVTFGTGIGVAMFVEGILIPNLELGHLELDGQEAEKAAAGVLVKNLDLTWQQWAEKVTWYLSYLERLMWPTLFIVGGGVSDAHHEWLHHVQLPNKTPIVPATSGNDAGIIGAAMAALAKAAQAMP